MMTNEEFAKAYKDYMAEYATGDNVSDEEYEVAAQEAHDELVRSLVEVKELLVRSLDMLYLLGYDSGFTNPAIEALTNDIKEFLKEKK